jgi:hypothetical protein
MLDPLFRRYIAATVFHISPGEQDRMPAVELDELICLHSTVSRIAEQKQEAQQAKGVNRGRS